MNWIVGAYGRNCHLDVWYVRGKYRVESLNCDFDIAPGLDFLIGLLVFGGAFYGPVMVALVVALTVFFVTYAADAARRALNGEPAEDPPKPQPRLSPYGDKSVHAALLRARGVPEDQIEAVLRTYD